jgi:hypothetical protein
MAFKTLTEDEEFDFIDYPASTGTKRDLPRFDISRYCGRAHERMACPRITSSSWNRSSTGHD